MSVEQYGARLLGEVHEESLDELLKELRSTVGPAPKNILGFPQIDHLLEIFRYPQRHSPPRRRGWPQGLEASNDEVYDDEDHHIGNRASRTIQDSLPPIIEVTSTKSAAIKTTLVYYLAALALLPVQHGGKDSLVIWMDSSNTFSATHLSQIITHILTSSKSNPQPLTQASLVDSTLNTSLRNHFILNPTSTPSLLTTLHSLSTHLLTNPRFTTQPRALSLLVLDSATSFSHQDRSAADIARLEAGPNASLPTQTSPSRTTQVINALRKVQREFECAVIFTTTTPPPTSISFPSHSVSRTTPHPTEPTPPSPWTSFATLSLVSARIPVPPFPPHGSLDECLLDREKRQAAISKARFSVSVNWAGSEMWGFGVREEVKRLEGRGKFVMTIVDDGVVDFE